MWAAGTGAKLLCCCDVCHQRFFRLLRLGRGRILEWAKEVTEGLERWLSTRP